MKRVGFSLVEVIVAMTLLSVGMLAVAGSAFMAMRLQTEAARMEDATTRARAVLDSVVVHHIVGSGQVAHAHFTIEWSGTVDDAVVTVRGIGITPFEMRAAR
jgi:prepilin-type N-terminal cleavage/methylation domain-containing protein